MSDTVGRCVMPGCFRMADTGHRCYLHELAIPPRAEFEAARLDPTTDRDRWDFGADPLERPGEDEWD